MLVGTCVASVVVRFWVGFMFVCITVLTAKVVAFMFVCTVSTAKVVATALPLLGKETSSSLRQHATNQNHAVGLEGVPGGRVMP